MRTPILAALIAGAPAALTAQVTWTPAPLLQARSAHAMAWDSARSVVVLFGGVSSPGAALADTWEWDGVQWHQRAPVVNPPARYGHALAYDSSRGKVVLFGGQSSPSNSFADTWEWDGTNWTQRSTATSPPARTTHALAFDAARGVILLCGGAVSDGGPEFGDVWTWDGTSWLQRATGPGARRGHALAFDSARSKVVLFGGQVQVQPGVFAELRDTWEWDGTSWLWRSTPPGLTGRSGHGLAYDAARGRTVMFPGTASTPETWEWDGTTWIRSLPVSTPTANGSTALAYDGTRGRVVLFGGQSKAETWEWDGINWAQRVLATEPAPAALGPALAYDFARARVVGFGGTSAIGYSAATREWDGATWTLRNPASNPPGRGYAALAFDSARGRAVMFGGWGGVNRNLADTWEWDGTNWISCSPASSPPGRLYHAMAYDSARGRVVLFGGQNYTPFRQLDDTWEWDGSNWTQRLPVASPPPRAGGALAYHAAAGKVLLFGGSRDGSVYYSDTWEWDGSNWTQRHPVAHPSARLLHAMTYDSARERTVLYGGAASGVPQADTWEWDGNNWLPRLPTASPSPRHEHAMAYDAARGVVVFFGGRSGDSTDPFSDTWEYAPIAPARWTPFGNGCSGSVGVPVLTATAVPWVGGVFALELTNAPASTAAIVSLGVSDVAWGTTPLPLALASIGMPGCSLFASSEMTAVVIVTGGVGSWSAGLPSTTAIVGARFFGQAIVIDNGANALGATISNAGAALIGQK